MIFNIIVGNFHRLEYVRLISYSRNLKTPTVVILLGFFFVLICDELCDEQMMNNFKTLEYLKLSIQYNLLKHSLH